MQRHAARNRATINRAKQRAATPRATMRNRAQPLTAKHSHAALRPAQTCRAQTRLSLIHI
eukprot:6903224-Lingulodinium_polyedra.AAC.1